MDLFPKSIEGYAQEEDPVRIYDAFVESLSMEDIEIEINCNKVGNSQYDPEAIDIWIFVWVEKFKKARTRVIP